MMRSGKIVMMIMERRKNRIDVAEKVPVGIVGRDICERGFSTAET